MSSLVEIGLGFSGSREEVKCKKFTDKWTDDGQKKWLEKFTETFSSGELKLNFNLQIQMKLNLGTNLEQIFRGIHFYLSEKVGEPWEIRQKIIFGYKKSQ